MKKSLILLLKITLVTVLTSNLIVYGIQSFASNVYTGQAYGKVNHFLAVKDTCNLFVLGSSRANHHIDPTVLTSKSFNMGMDGRRFFFNEALFYLLPDSSTVLFHIDASEFYDDAESMDRLVPHFGKSKVLDKSLISREKISLLERILGSLRYNNTLLALIGNKFFPGYNTIEYHGYDPIYPSKMDSLNLVRVDLLNEESDSIIREPVNQAVIEGLIRIKDHLRSVGTTCVFFTSPLLHGCHVSDSIFMDSIFSDLELIYIDYSNDMVGTELKNWKDGTHLSHSGAESFMQKVFSSITKPTNISADGF